MKEELLHAEQVTMRFGGLLAINQVSCQISRGEIVGIIGPNGAGKTTLFNMFTGIYQPTEGDIYFKGTSLRGMKPHKIAKLGISRTFQNIRLFDGMTVLDNVMVGQHCRTEASTLDAVLKLRRHRDTEKSAEEKALRLLELTGLSDYRYEYGTSLAYGLQRKLEIARAIATQPELLLLDEPAAGMNERETAELTDFIREVQRMGYTILLIEHDVQLVMQLCDHIYVLDHGNLIAHGAAEEVRDNPAVIEAYLGGGD